MRRGAGGFDFCFGDDFVRFVIPFRAQRSRRVFDLPAQFRIRLHRLPAERRAVQEKFHLFAIAEGLDEDFLAFPARPIPVRQQVQHGVGRPPRFVVIENVLRKTARVENAEMRADARPPIWRRLAAIIEAGPDERTGEPRAGGKETPPAFGGGGPARPDDVVGGDVTVLAIVRVNAARADDAGLLGADVWLGWMLGVITVHVGAVMIIPAAHFDDGIDAAIHVAFRRSVGDRARRVELLDVILHRARDVAGLRRVLHGELLVGDAPHCDARMIAVAADLVVPLFHVPRIAAHQAALVQDQHAEAVADIEQFRRGRVVRGADGVATERFQLLHAKFLQRIRNGRADTGRVLMIAGAVNLVMLAVQQKAVRRVKADGADAERSGFLVNHFAVHRNCCDELVKFRIFRRPKLIVPQ